MSFIKQIPNVIIRKASEKDVDDWAKILHESSEITYSHYISRDYLNKNYNVETLKENFLQEINLRNQVKSNSELYMIILDNAPVGILKIGQPVECYTDGNNYYRKNTEGIGEIKSLHIKSEYQGRGIGNKAISFAENRLRELNYKISHLWVKQENTKAIEFYKRMGYSKTNFVNPNTNDKAPSMVMEKEIEIKQIGQRDGSFVHR